MKYSIGTVGSPCGPLLCVVDRRGAVVAVEFVDAAGERGICERLREEGHSVRTGRLRTRPVRRQLERYFAGELLEFELELEPGGSPFQQAVWRALREIPYGETRTYGELAKSSGHPGAGRAVGRAIATNPIPIIIPCHRVLGSDGSLVGFGGGLPAKKLLLLLEARHRPHPRDGQLDLEFDPG